MNKEQFIESIATLHYGVSQALLTREKNFIERLSIIRRHILDDTEIQEVRADFQNTFHTQTQHHFNILSREIDAMAMESINNPQSNFDQQYDNIIRRVLRFDQFTETRSNDLLSQYDSYHERYYPNAPIFIPRDAAVSSTESIEPQPSSGENTASADSSDFDIDDRFKNIHDQLALEKINIAKRIKEWIKSHYSIREQDNLFSICIKHSFDLDKRIASELSKLQAAAKDGYRGQEFEEQLERTLRLIQDDRMNILKTLLTSPDLLHTLNYEVDDGLTVNPFSNLTINITAPPLIPPALYNNQAVLDLIAAIGETFNPELYNFLESTM